MRRIHIVQHETISNFGSSIFALTIGITTNAAQVYSWEAKENIPSKLTGAGATAVNGKVYVYGGNSGTSGDSTEVKNRNMYIYDPIANTRTTSGVMGGGRTGTANAVLNNKIFAIGGYNTEAVLTKTLQVYDISSGTWSVGPDALSLRVWGGAASINDKIYVFGGKSQFSPVVALKHVEVFDPATQVWTRLNDLPSESLTTKVIQYNGRNFILNLNSQIIWEYNAATDSYSTVTNIPRNRVASEPALLNGKIYLVGSDDIENNTWASEIPNPDPKNDANVVAVNGHIYTFGGRTTASGGNSNAVKMLVESTINEPAGNNAILTIYLVNGQIKEYDVTTLQLNSFLDWYDARSSGVGFER